MGIFDRLFGRKQAAETSVAEAAASPAVPASWKQRFAAAASVDNFDWSWGNARAHAVVHEFLGEARPSFGTPDRPAKIKERPDDEHIDLRGNYDGAPIRFAVWMSFGSFWTIEMKVPMSFHALDLERDLEKMPKVGDEEDPFDEDEERRVFVGKGVFFEGSDEDVARKLSVWQALAETDRDAIIEGMGRVDARALYYAGESIILNQTPALWELEEPIAYMRACGDLMIRLRDAYAEAELPSADLVEPATLATARISCRYCSSLYFLSPGHPRCPNCGAPAQG